MRHASKLLVLAVASVLVPRLGGASCVCQCVNGEVEAICSSAIEVPPVCAPRVCPIVPPKVEPITPPTVPPVGTSRCQMVQVYDEEAREYVWKKVCY